MEKSRKKLSFRPKLRLDFPCKRYRWRLFLLYKYPDSDQESILMSAQKLREIEEYILKEFPNWDCLDIELRLRLYALCKKKGTGEIFKIPYEIFCED